VGQEPQPAAICVGIGANSITVEARWWTDSKRADDVAVKDRVIPAVKERLLEHGIEIAYPTLRRLFRWLKEKGVTAIITAERGDGALTRHGLEEYVSDCVILLDHRVTEQVSTRLVSTGVPRLDAMLGGKGVFRGSSILVSGTAGSGKSSLAAHFAQATAARGERCLYFAFEETGAASESNGKGGAREHPQAKAGGKRHDCRV